MTTRQNADLSLRSGVRLKFAERVWKGSGRTEKLTIACIFVILYVLTDIATNVFELEPGVTRFYPPAGLAFAFFLIYGKRWAVAFLAAALASAMTARGFPGSLDSLVPMALAKLLVYLGAAELVRLRGFDPLLRRARDVYSLVAVAILAPIPIAVFANYVIYTGVVDPWTQSLEFWLGDFLGVLAIAPVVLLLWGEMELRKHERGSRAKPLDLRTMRDGAAPIVVVLLMAASCALVFSIEGSIGAAAYSLLLLPLLWAALKGGTKNAVFAVLTLIIASMIWQFVVRSSAETLIETQLLVATLAIASLFAGVAITSRQAIVSQLEASEAHLKQAESLAGLSSFEWDPISNRITVGHHVENLLGYELDPRSTTLDEIIECVDEIERSSVRGALMIALEQETPLDRVVTFRPADGSLARFHCRSAVRSDPGGRRRLVVMCRNVSSELEREKQFGRMEKRMRRFADVTKVVAWEARADNWRFTFIAPEIEQLLGYPREWWYRESFWTEHVHPDDRKRVENHYRNYPGETGPLAIEYRMLAAGGHIVWVHDVIESDPKASEPRLVHGFMFDVTNRRVAEERLRHVSLHDPLTGLPNRGLLRDRLHHALDRLGGTDELALLHVDLTRFKLINDSLGSAIGDDLLRRAARRLSRIVGTTNTVARVSGDEYMILIDVIDGVDKARELGRRIIEALTSRFEIQGHEIHVGANCGITIAGSGDNIEMVLSRADIALQQSKRSGESGVVVFESAMEKKFLRRKRTEDDLRTALDRSELLPFFQPIISLESGAITGVEALMRWRHPTRGILPPGNFIAVAEETGTITEIDLRILREGCRQLARWQRVEGRTNLSLSVNFSGLHFRSSAVVRKIQETLEETGIDPGTLHLELTESVLIGDSDTAMEVMNQVVDLGVEVHLDDFGTGYASLVYLQMFPFSAVKIDRSFVSSMLLQPKSLEVVRSIVALCHTLDLRVVAEGVEEVAHVNELKSLGCHLFQGFLISPALPSEEVTLLLDDDRFAGHKTRNGPATFSGF
ncbi:MAG: EAL domain-containing protein [Acidobacteria bacterium]|nr:EAL domain-containing protein [Acidobacteriota bacterium]